GGPLLLHDRGLGRLLPRRPVPLRGATRLRQAVPIPRGSCRAAAPARRPRRVTPARTTAGCSGFVEKRFGEKRFVEKRSVKRGRAGEGWGLAPRSSGARAGGVVLGGFRLVRGCWDSLPTPLKKNGCNRRATGKAHAVSCHIRGARPF